MIALKSPAEIDAMRAAGRAVARALAAMAAGARTGMTLRDVDDIAAQVFRDEGARSSFTGYAPAWAPSPFPGVTCQSVNDVVVHGVPDDRVLRDGDVLSIDCGAIVDGWHGDAAVTVVLGAAPPQVDALVSATREALHAGIAAALPGGRLGDIGAAVSAVAEKGSYGQLADHGGHGIGRALHEEPHVPNTGRAGRGMRLREGLVIAIEPMFHAGGRPGYRKLEDGWSLATDDGSLAAHWEHTVAITPDGPVILTEL
ncbi:MAG: type I methionyl aminopeptidase [Actinomycetota bacterium]|nr:type I methionyl aminopeptidase [Actinomycetota bacterium]